MISSAAFPNVAFRSPPSDSEVLSAISSVARPIRNASGIMAANDEKKAIE